MHHVRVIDSHTEGEPTRVVVEGGPDLGRGSVADQLRAFRERFDSFRSAIVNEPRGYDHLVGAMIVPPVSPRAVCGVIFFNNVGFLNACGHGTIGLAVTLRHLGRIKPGRHVIETPVGEVAVHLGDHGDVTIDNVPAYRHAARVPVSFDWNGARRTIHGDIAWGGNWFYLIEDHGLDLARAPLSELSAFCHAVRRGLVAANITGASGGEIDHIELFGPPTRPDCDSRNFVLCPGGAYDRSPCGTGTSAKLACLLADGKLADGQPWRQESIIASRFTGRIRRDGDRLIPSITGSAYITAESTLLLDPTDPFTHGIGARS